MYSQSVTGLCLIYNVYTPVHLYIFNFKECTVLKAATVEFLACIPLGWIIAVCIFSVVLY